MPVFKVTLKKWSPVSKSQWLDHHSPLPDGTTTSGHSCLCFWGTVIIIQRSCQVRLFQMFEMSSTQKQQHRAPCQRALLAWETVVHVTGACILGIENVFSDGAFSNYSAWFGICQGYWRGFCGCPAEMRSRLIITVVTDFITTTSILITHFARYVVDCSEQQNHKHPLRTAESLFLERLH